MHIIVCKSLLSPNHIAIMWVLSAHNKTLYRKRRQEKIQHIANFYFLLIEREKREVYLIWGLQLAPNNGPTGNGVGGKGIPKHQKLFRFFYMVKGFPLNMIT